MKTVTINAIFRKVPIKKKVNRELRWYDVEKKELLIFNGGQLSFEYKYDKEFNKHRMLPKVIDLEVIESKNKSNIEDIKDWAKINLNYSNAEIIETNENAVLFSVPDEEVNDFVDSLDRRRFEYEIF